MQVRSLYSTYPATRKIGITQEKSAGVRLPFGSSPTDLGDFSKIINMVLKPDNLQNKEKYEAFWGKDDYNETVGKLKQSIKEKAFPTTKLNAQITEEKETVISERSVRSNRNIPDWQLTQLTVKAIGEVGKQEPELYLPLLKLLSFDKDEAVKEEILITAGKIGNSQKFIDLMDPMRKKTSYHSGLITYIENKIPV